MKINITFTQGVASNTQSDREFCDQVEISILRYLQQDWGDLCDEDKAMNDHAFKSGNERIVARYNTKLGVIYIITEADRSATTVLFASEY